MTIADLKDRIDALWNAGDASILPGYREMSNTDLRSQYAWVGDLPERTMMMVRGEVNPTAPVAAFVQECPWD